MKPVTRLLWKKDIKYSRRLALPPTCSPLKRRKKIETLQRKKKEMTFVL
jgi:hypothetical protein